MKILSFESSCDETSVSVTEDGEKVLSNVVLSQIDIFKEYGGVVPEISSREHVKGITYAYLSALKNANCTMDDIDYVAVTEGPGLIGSLLTGITAAKTVALNYNKPLVGVNHLSGHIYAARINHEIKFPCLALVISGGHTELICMKEDYHFEVIGRTLDDAVGESFDKVARILGIPYPGGPLLDKIARNGKDIYNLPRPALTRNDYSFSFSGLKSAVRNLYDELVEKNIPFNKEDIAYSFEKAVADSLVSKIKKYLKENSINEIIAVGGSAANSCIRETLTNEIKDIPITFPELKYCGDNAAMIGISAYYKIKKGEIDDMNLSPDSKLDL